LKKEKQHNKVRNGDKKRGQETGTRNGDKKRGQETGTRFKILFLSYFSLEEEKRVYTKILT
jgi:hypothetical protein